MMTRTTIQIDEWAGYALLAALCPAECRETLFWIALAAHLLTLYGVSYPEMWRASERADPTARTPLRWLRALRGAK